MYIRTSVFVSFKTYPKFNRAGGSLGKLRTKVPKSFMRSSNSGGGIFGKLRTEVLKSSMTSSNSEGWEFLVSSEPKSLSRP